MKRYLLRPRAEADLAEVWRFTAERWNIDQANRYYTDLIAALTTLAEQPSLGRTCDDIRPGYSRHNVAAHVIFYRLSAGEIDVVRILHGRRDFRRHLPKQ